MNQNDPERPRMKQNDPKLLRPKMSENGKSLAV